MVFRTGSVVLTGIKNGERIKDYLISTIDLTSEFFGIPLKITENTLDVKSIMCRSILPTQHKYSPRFYELFFKTYPPRVGERWGELSYEAELRPGYFLVKYDSVTFLFFFSSVKKPASVTVFGKSLKKMNEIYKIIHDLLKSFT